MKFNPGVIALIVILTICVAKSSHATIYQLTTRSEIRQIMFNSGSISAGNQAVLGELGLSLGAPLLATYLLDDSVDPVIIIDLGEEYVSYDAVLGAQFSLPEFSGEFDLSLNSGYALNDDLVGHVDIVSVIARTTLMTSVGEVSMSLVSVLYDETGFAIDNIELDPFVFIDLEPWEPFEDGARTGMFLTMRFPNDEVVRFYAEYTVNSVQAVPVPGAGWLMLMALSGLFATRKRACSQQ